MKSITAVNKQIIQGVIKRTGEDGLVLSDRVWNLSGDMRDRLSSVIRPSVLKGESITMISQKIKEVHDNEKWKVERVAISESTNTYRAATIQNGLESEIVTGYQIIDNGHRHRYHSKHMCYKLARRDAYGFRSWEVSEKYSGKSYESINKPTSTMFVTAELLNK